METRNTGHAMTQGISFLPVTTKTLVRFRESRRVTFVEQSATGTCLLRVFQFPPANIIPAVVQTHLSITDTLWF